MANYGQLTAVNGEFDVVTSSCKKRPMCGQQNSIHKIHSATEITYKTLIYVVITRTLAAKHTTLKPKATGRQQRKNVSTKMNQNNENVIVNACIVNSFAACIQIQYM
jgi:hypothetical protein